MYSPAIVDVPPGSELIEEWELFYGMAQRLGRALSVNGISLDMNSKPTTDDLYDLITAGSRIPLTEVRKFGSGHTFDTDTVVVGPADDELPEECRLRVGDYLMLSQLSEVGGELLPATDEKYPYLLTPRRMREMKNSYGMDLQSLANRHRINPAFMHPEDLAQLDLASGDAVEIRSNKSTIMGIVESDETMLRGCVSMTHGWGDLPERDAEFGSIGSNTSRLIDNASDFDEITGMPRMSAIPVAIGLYRSGDDGINASSFPRERRSVRAVDPPYA